MTGGGPLSPLTSDAASGTVVDRLVDVATALSSAVAVADAERTLTFGALLVGAAAIAGILDDANPDRRPVAVLHGHGVGAVTTAVGVIATGAPLIMLDAATPPARLRDYVTRAGADVCLAESGREAVAAEICSTVLVAPERQATAMTEREAAERLRRSPATPVDPVAIVYTSGSTGKPKGVASSSGYFLHDAWTNSLSTGCYGPEDVVANLLPMAFSAGINLTIGALLVGATQQLFDPRGRTVAHLPRWLETVGATVLVASPAIMRGVVTALAPGQRLNGLRVLTVAGETVHGRELAAIRAAVGRDCEIRNRYGSTETGLISEFRLGPDESAPSGATPVGWPLPGIRVLVRDGDGELQDSGTGRLVVRSRWLGPGYWNAPEGTDAVFSTDASGERVYLTSDTGHIDATGCIRLLGRTDYSVKIRGQLVEPGEIDAALFARPEIREAVVVGVQPDPESPARLVAYVVPAVARLSASLVRRAVREVLPAFMVPQDVVFLPVLPRTERGKLDRSALPPVEDEARGSTPARTDWERVVGVLFARVLELDEIGIHDDFFALGGDSLAAEALMAAMADELGLRQDALATSLLVEAPTVAQFAKAVRRRRLPSQSTMVRFNPSGHRPPLVCVAGAGGVAVAFTSLARRLGPDQPVLALQAHGLENPGLPDWSVEASARRHLRTVRTVQPSGPYRLAGHSLGGLIALEMAQQLAAQGEEVEFLAILDSFPPDPALVPPFLQGNLFERLKSLVALVTTGVLPDPGLGHYLRFHRQGMAIERRYRTRSWSGRTLVLVARDDEYAELRLLWSGHLEGPWTLVQVPGDHVGMLHEPNVVEVASALASELEALGGDRREGGAAVAH